MDNYIKQFHNYWHIPIIWDCLVKIKDIPEHLYKFHGVPSRLCRGTPWPYFASVRCLLSFVRYLRWPSRMTDVHQQRFYKQQTASFSPHWSTLHPVLSPSKHEYNSKQEKTSLYSSWFCNLQTKVLLKHQIYPAWHVNCIKYY